MFPRFGLLIVALGGIVLAAACAAPAPTPTPTRAIATPTPARAKPSAVSGKAIYDTNCASCHGTAGKGDGAPSLNPANFANLTFMRQATPTRFFDIISNGKAGTAMPSFGVSLSEGDRWNVLFYEWSFSTTPQKVNAGKQVYDTNCAACHGTLGKGDGPAGTSLSPKPADFTAEAMMKESDQKLFDVITNGKLPMPSFKQLSEDDRWNVVGYLRTFGASLFP